MREFSAHSTEIGLQDQSPPSLIGFGLSAPARPGHPNRPMCYSPPDLLHHVHICDQVVTTLPQYFLILFQVISSVTRIHAWEILGKYISVFQHQLLLPTVCRLEDMDTGHAASHCLCTNATEVSVELGSDKQLDCTGHLESHCLRATSLWQARHNRPLAVRMVSPSFDDSITLDCLANLFSSTCPRNSSCAKTLPCAMRCFFDAACLWNVKSLRIRCIRSTESLVDK